MKIGKLLLSSILSTALLSTSMHAEEPTGQPKLPANFQSGEISLRMKQMDETSLAVVLECSVPGIAGIIVHIPGDDQDLVRLATENLRPLIAEALGPRPARATASITEPTVEGKVSLMLVHNLGTATHIQLLAVTLTGEVVPLDFHAPSFADGSRYSVSFSSASRASGCYDAVLACGPPTNCSLTQQCCTRKVTWCGNCAACTIACPPCEILP